MLHHGQDDRQEAGQGQAQGEGQGEGQGQGRRRDQPRPPSVVAPTVRQPGVERRRNHPMRAKDGHMQVLLTHAVPHFGQPGDLVKVRPGFARNYLLPQGLATFATPHNLRIVEKHRERLRQLEEARRADLLQPRRPDRPAVDHDRGQRQRRGAPLRLGQRRPDRRRPQGRQLPDRRPTTSRSRARSRSWASTRSGSHLGQDVDTEVKLWVVPTHVDEPTA